MHINLKITYGLLIVLIVVTRSSYSFLTTYVSGQCCTAAWTVGPLSTKAAYGDFINLDLNCDVIRCTYRTCGESGFINGVYYDTNLPMEWNKTENKFKHGRFYCGRGDCNAAGCNCDGGCLTYNLQNSPGI